MKDSQLRIEDIDTLVESSLRDLIVQVFENDWIGRERELVSLYAFGCLLDHCKPGSFLHHPSQIGIEVAVPQLPGERRKAQVCKDLIIWPAPRMTCWDTHRRAVKHPAVVIEWKADRTKVDSRDVAWLREYSKSRRDFLGYAVCVDSRARKFKLACARVHDGQVQPAWLMG